MPNNRYKILAGALVAFLVIGCTSLNNRVFRAEKLAVDTTYGSVQFFNKYYAERVKTANSNEVAELDKQKEQVYDMSRKIAASRLVVRDLRTNYVANMADTNRTALLCALDSLNASATNIAVLVKSFTSSTSTVAK